MITPQLARRRDILAQRSARRKVARERASIVLPEPRPDRDDVYYPITCGGFGDNIYQRSIIRALARKYRTFYLPTPCPAIYWDIPNIKFVDPGKMSLRTQSKHLASLPKSTFSPLPFGVNTLPWRYEPMPAAGWARGGGAARDGMSHVEHLRNRSRVSLANFDFELPVKPEWIADAEAVKATLKLSGKRLCLVRPSTLRKEWLYPPRTPKVEYLQLLIDRYKNDYFYLSFADLEPGVEWIDGELTGIDAEFHKGELSITTIFGLIKISDMIITGAGFPMVVAIAERAKCFTIFASGVPVSCYLDDSMGLKNFSYVAPRIGQNNKDIPEENVIERFEELRNRPFDKSHEKPVDSLFIRGTAGFGDNLGLRLVIKHLAKTHKTIYLKTTIPEFYWDIPNVKFVFPDGPFYDLRSQKRHLSALPRSMFVDPPAGIKETRSHYGIIYSDIGGGKVECYHVGDDGVGHKVARPAQAVNVFEDIRQAVGIPSEEFDFSIPVKDEWVASARDAVASLDLKGKKLCVIIPPTIRAEWENISRNPRLEYYQLLIDRYKDEYFFLSVADLEDKKEWLIGELRGIDAVYHRAELSVATLLGLLKIADMVITCNAFGLLFGIATRAKTFCIFGGCSSPEAMCDEAMGLDNFGYAAPEPFCLCWQRWHDCNKEIPEEKLLAAFEELRNRPLR